jgi:biotin carboxyl carrier protein
MTIANEWNGAGDQSKPLATTGYRVDVGGRVLAIAVIEREDGRYVRIDGGPEQRLEVLLARDDGELSLLVGSDVLRGLVGQQGDERTVAFDGHLVAVTVVDERAARLASAAAGGRHRHTETAIRAPMPGLVVAVPVESGQRVVRGTTLVVLSAMKMQNELTAPADGTITDVLVSAGQTVDQNQVLVRLE